MIHACRFCGLEIQFEPRLSTPNRPVYTHKPSKRRPAFEVGCPAQPLRRATPRAAPLDGAAELAAHVAKRGGRLVQPMPPSARRTPSTKRRRTRFDVRGR